MPNIHSIAARLVMSITALAAAGCALVALLAISKQSEMTKVALEREMGLAYQSVIASFDAEGRAAAAVASAVANIPAVADATEREDRADLANILGPAELAGLTQGVDRWSITKPPGITVFRVHTPGSFGDDVRARRPTVVEAYQRQQPATGVETGIGNVGMYSVSPITKHGTMIGAFDIGIPFSTHFVDRIKARFGFDLAVHQSAPEGFKTLGSSLAGGTLATPAEMQAVIAGATELRRTSLGGRPVALYLGQLRDFAGRPVAVVELVKDIGNIVSGEVMTRWYLIGATSAVILVAAVVAHFVAVGMTRPIDRLKLTMDSLSAGDVTSTSPGAIARMSWAPWPVPSRCSRRAWSRLIHCARGRRAIGQRPSRRAAA